MILTPVSFFTFIGNMVYVSIKHCLTSIRKRYLEKSLIPFLFLMSINVLLEYLE